MLWRGGPARVRRAGPVLLAALGVGALLIVWILGAPPNSAPDAPASLIRGYGAGTAQWSGAPAHDSNIGLHDQIRIYRVPGRLAVLNAKPCYDLGAAGGANTPADCRPYFPLESGPADHGYRAASPSGAYYPVMYVPLGLAERFAPSADAADYAGRTVSAVLCGGLLVLAFGCLRRRVERVGWLVAITPLTLFTATTAATNGLEVCAGIAVVCALQAIRTGPRRAGVVAFVVGGFVLTSAKELGPLWWVTLVVLSAAAGRFRGWAPRWWAFGPPVGGAIGNIVWTSRFLPGGSVSTLSLGQQIHLATKQVLLVPQGTYSYFGKLEVHVQHFLWEVGVAGYVAMVVICLLRTDWWGRGVIVAAVGAGYIAAVAFAVLEIRAGFGLQARYTLVLTATAPLLAAMTVSARQRPERRWLRVPLDRPATAAVAGAALAANLLAAYFELKRFATGDRAPGFLRHVRWSPPGGIAVQVVLAVAGALLLAGAVLGPRERPAEEGGGVTREPDARFAV